MKESVRTKIIFTLLLAAMYFTPVKGQFNYQLSQYWQNATAINPAFSGIDNFLDLKVGYRQQWSALDQAPQTYYLGISGVLVKPKYESLKNNALRISDPTLYDEKETDDFKRSAAIKHGWGGYIIRDAFGPFEQTSGFLNYSLHYPLSRTMKFTAGLGGGISNNRINPGKIEVRDPDNDETYQKLLAEGGNLTTFDLNAGGLLYSEKFYLGYSAMGLMQNKLFEVNGLNNENTSIVHNFMGGFQINLGPDYLLLPSVWVRMTDILPMAIDYNLKFRYLKSFWGGMSYRNGEAMSVMAGFYINEKFNFGYSYDFSVSGMNEFTRGSHELVLGMMLSNPSGAIPFLW
ncbi:MAG: PorP/SprF family type IX secretion system membrane protein [Candidatus Cyclobacteriaceae bacterium M3_2C_046]